MMQEKEGFGDLSITKRVEPLLIHMRANGKCPRIKLSR
jgi:hypothetical protein